MDEGMQRIVDDTWVWGPDRFEETFGRRLPGKFAENFPAGKRIVAVLTFDTQGDVDAAIPKLGTRTWPDGSINYCDLTMRQYDITEGLPRILRILDKHGIKGTFAVTGMTADWYPDDIRAIEDQGHEVAVHSHRHLPMFQLSEAEQREETERATEAVARVVQSKPVGYRSPFYTSTQYTLDHLRDLGYLWNSDFHDAEFPYVLEKDGRPIVEIPAGHDDFSQWLLMPGPGSVFPQMGGTPYGSPETVFQTMKMDFDVLYEESADRPRMVQWCMHPCITGRPFRAAVLDQLIDHMKGHDGVWFATCQELAALA
jgi:peptidoglycan-N-acetylglucosamine deacetylase